MGGGGDGGFAKAQAGQEQAKQRARYALNSVFGVAPGEAPNPDDFYDRPSYQKSLKAYQDALPDVGKNKAAIEALYSGVRDNAFGAGKRGLDENYERAARDNKFALFAQGLNGGSVDVDESALLRRTLDTGLLNLGAKADAAKADFRGNDEQTRLGLLQSIDAGMDQGSALTSALNQMRINSDRATSQAQGTDIGNLFEGAGLLYTKSQAARGQQAARDWWGSNYAPRGRSGSSTGIISPTGG